MLYRTDYTTKLPKFDFTSDVKKLILNEPTGNFFYDPWKIKKEYEHTPWQDILDSLPFQKGEARLIKMKYGTTYMAHADIDDRWHLSLQGDESYLIDLDNNEMHLLEQDGYWYSMDAGRIHVAANFGSIDRYQLVVRKLLNKNELDTPVYVKVTAIEVPFNIRYLFDKSFSVILNKLNKSGSITEFKQESEVSISFKIEQSALPTINNCISSCGFKTKVEYL